MNVTTQKRALLGLLIIPVILTITGIGFLFAYQQQYIREELATGIAICIGIIVIIIIYLLITQKLLVFLQNGKKPLKVLKTLHLFFMVISLGAIIYGSYMAFFPLSSIRYNTGPVLTWGSEQDPSNAITVMWRTSQPSASIVYYGTSKANLNQQTRVSETVEWHRVALTGLTPNTQYYYRVEGQSLNNIHDFITAPITTANFTFLLFADVRQNSGNEATISQPDVPQYMMDKMKAQGIRPAFTIVCGDITRTATNNYTWKSWFDDITSSDLGTQAVVQDTPGNHERSQNATGEIFASIYPYTNHPNFYYSFNYSSSLHILSLDPMNYTNYAWGAISPEQLAWAEADLKNAQSMPYIIVTIHPPPVRSGKIVEIYRPLINLCDKYGVDAVFFGHVHDFEYSRVNNTYYYMIGVGGNTAASPCGFSQIDLTTTAMRISMQWLNGTTQFLTQIEP